MYQMNVWVMRKKWWIICIRNIQNLEDEIIKHYENLGEENIFEKIKIMFAMHNGRKYDKLIWSLIKK